MPNDKLPLPHNIPIRTEEGRKIREAFRRPNLFLVPVDYSELEVRVLATAVEPFYFRKNAPEHPCLICQVEKKRMEEKIRQMIAEGYIQLSRKYRLLGNLPEGKTGIEAMREVDPRMAQHFQDTFDRQMKEQFLRVYGKVGEHVVELTQEEFSEFLRQRKEAGF